LFKSDSSDDEPPPLVNGDESDDEDRDGEAQEKGRPMTPPSPPPMRRFRFLGRLPPPPDQRGFRYLRQHARPRDIPEPPDLPDDVRVLIGPVRPVSPDSVALEHMINAAGGDPVPPPRHGVLNSGATVTVLTSKHRDYIYELDDSLSGSAVATVARGGVLLIDGGGRAGVFDGVLYSETLRNTVVSVSQVTRHGFQVTFSGYTAEAIHPDGHRIPCVKQPAGRDIWWVPLDQIFEATS
jgi:hypothetical protein